MKTKSFFRLFFVGALAIMALSCKKEQPKEKGFDVAQFAVQMSEITAVSANAQVTVTENMNAPWYGFVTTDLESKAEDLVDAVVSKLNVGWDILNTGNKSVPVENLIPGGFNYRYIVTGLAPDGRSYGTPAEVNFRTVMDYSVNPNWSVSFIGTVLEEGEYLTYYKVNGLEEGGYFGYIVVTAEDYNTYGAAEIASKDAETIIRAGAVSENIFDEDDNYKWDALTPGDYYFIMYGVDKDYNPTMKYIAQPFTVEAATDAYESYVGTWYTVESDLFTIEEETINEGYLFCEDMYAYFEQGAITFYFESLGNGYYEVGLDENGDVLPIYDLLGYGVISEDGKSINFVGAEYEPKTGVASTKMTATANVAAITIAEYTQKGWVEVPGAPVLTFPTTVSSDEPQPTEAYSAWIGTWYTPSVDPIEIKQGIINQTLILTGLFKDYEVKVSFDKESGDIAFFTQQIGEYNGAPIVFTGRDTGGYIEDAEQADPAYLLATASLADDGKSFELVGNQFEAIYSGKVWEEEIASMKLYVFSNQKFYSMNVIDENETELILTMGTYTDAIPEPSEEYLAWIGDWSIVRIPEVSHEATQDDVDAGKADELGELIIDQAEVADIWTISEGKMNSSYIISGIEGLDWVEAEAEFSKEDGTISLKQQTVLENDYLEAELVSEAYNGLLYNGYYGDIFVASLNEDGSATLTPEKDYFYYAPIKNYLYSTVTGFHVYGYIGEYTSFWNEDATPLPNTMKKAVDDEEVSAKSSSVAIENWKEVPVRNFVMPENVQIVTLVTPSNKNTKKTDSYTLPQQKAKSLKGEAPQGTGKRDKKGPAYGGGKRGKLNQ